jgi:hypothetical protein
VTMYSSNGIQRYQSTSIDSSLLSKAFRPHSRGLCVFILCHTVIFFDGQQTRSQCPESISEEVPWSLFHIAGYAFASA